MGWDWTTWVGPARGEERRSSRGGSGKSLSFTRQCGCRGKRGRGQAGPGESGGSGRGVTEGTARVGGVGTGGTAGWEPCESTDAPVAAGRGVGGELAKAPEAWPPRAAEKPPGPAE